MDADSEVLLIHAFTHGIYGSGKSYKTGRIAAMGGMEKAMPGLKHRVEL